MTELGVELGGLELAGCARADVVPLVRARGLRRAFRQGRGEVVALAEASCTVMPGDRIAVTGPSGSGKSTLLNLLAGLDTPGAGELSWPALGPRSSLRPIQVGVAPQTPGLLPALTVVENVALPLLLVDVAPPQANASARAILEQLALDDLAAKLPEEISGGQAQRVSLARALVTRPRLVLADEPTGQLDHPTAQRLFDVLAAMLAGSDTALIVATHDAAVAERLARTWTMQQGVLKEGIIQ